MLKLLALRHRNTKVFDDVFIRLDTPGIIGVGGVNLLARQVGAQTDSNAVGKSMLLNGIPNLLFERMSRNHPTKSKTSYFRQDLGFTRIWFQSGSSDIFMVELNSEGKYALFRNGVAFSASRAMKIKDSILALRELIPLTEMEYHTRYAASLQPSDFINGASGDRVTLIGELFNFSKFDTLQAGLKKEFGTKLAGIGQRVQDASSRVVSLQERINTFDSDLVGYAQGMETAKQELAALKAQLGGMTQYDFVTAQARTLDIQAILKNLDTMPSLEEIQQEKREAEQEMAHLFLPKADSAALGQEHQYLSTVRARLQNSHFLTSSYLESDLKARTAPRRLSPEEVQQVIRADQEAEPHRDWVLSHLAQQDAARAEYARCGFVEEPNPLFPSDVFNELEGIAKLLDKSMSPAAYGFEVPKHVSTGNGARDLVDYTQSTLSVFQQFFPVIKKEAEFKVRQAEQSDAALASGTCPTCGQATHAIGNTASTARATLDLIDRAIVAADRLQASLNWYRLCVQDVESVTATWSWVVETELWLLRQVDGHLSALEEEMQAQDNQAKNSAKRQQELSQRCAALAQAEQYRTIYNEMSLVLELDKLDKILAQGQAISFDDLNRQIDEWEQYHNRCVGMHAGLSLLLEQLEEAKAQQSALLPLQQEALAVNVLKDFYAPAGGRMKLMEATSHAIQDAYNLNSPMLYSEPIEFECVPSGKDMAILYKRQTDNGKFNDVVATSASETRRFDLLNLFTLNSMLGNRAANYCVLDEAETGMSDANLSMYLNTFLPHLLTVVPTIFVVSPKAEVLAATDYQVTVIRGMDGSEQSRIQVSDDTLTRTDDLVEAGYGEML